MRDGPGPCLDAVERLLVAMSTPGAFYVLGAGASFGLVPTTAELRHIVKARYSSVGSFPASKAPRSEMYNRVVGGIREPRVDDGEDPFSHDNMAEMVLPTIRPQVLDMLVRMELVPPVERIVPSQYAAFNAAASGTIFSFNLDGLAEAYCGRRHIVLEPHGRVERELFESDAFAEMWMDLASLDLGVPDCTEKILLRPEPDRLLESEVYQDAIERIAAAKFVVFVGYSFSRYGPGRDDEASLYFLADQLRRRPKPVFVVDPFPDEVSAMLCDGTRRNLVTAVHAKWNVLSAAIDAGIHASGHFSIHGRSAEAERIVAIYRSLIDDAD
jgi:hypothetical protein